ncbi:carbamate kinase, partial [Pseudomonas carnis]
MRIVVALGGNALLRRGEPMTADNQRANIRIATEQIAKIHPGNELVIAHGNGPQVGLLSLQAAAYTSVSPYPLDVLGAETEGMIGYIIEQELGNLLDFEVPFATLLTQVEVDAKDPAFQNPTKPIGPVYPKAEAEKLAAEKGWAIAPDGDKYRRVVASPRPKRIFEIRPIKWLLEKKAIVICAGGGGIPTMYGEDGKLRGIEAVIDKDLCSSLLATQLEADLLVIATDVNAAFI